MIFTLSPYKFLHALKVLMDCLWLKLALVEVIGKLIEFNKFKVLLILGSLIAMF
jgi:hypothetical protein